jgi:hypothetical protein
MMSKETVAIFEWVKNEPKNYPTPCSGHPHLRPGLSAYLTLLQPG